MSRSDKSKHKVSIRCNATNDTILHWSHLERVCNSSMEKRYMIIYLWTEWSPQWFIRSFSIVSCFLFPSMTPRKNSQLYKFTRNILELNVKLQEKKKGRGVWGGERPPNSEMKISTLHTLYKNILTTIKYKFSTIKEHIQHWFTKYTYKITYINYENQIFWGNLLSRSDKSKHKVSIRCNATNDTILHWSHLERVCNSSMEYIR